MVGHIKRICLDSNIAKHLIEKNLKKKKLRWNLKCQILNDGLEEVIIHFLNGAVKAKQQNWDFLHIRDSVSAKKRESLIICSWTWNKHWKKSAFYQSVHYFVQQS